MASYICTRPITGAEGELLSEGSTVPEAWDQGSPFFLELLALGAIRPAGMSESRPRPVGRRMDIGGVSVRQHRS